MRSSTGNFCDFHFSRSNAEKREALERAAEEKRRKKLELPDPFSAHWNFPQEESNRFHSGVDVFEICSVLELLPNFTKQQLRDAYKQKARELHPDKNSVDTTDQFQHLQAVYKQALAALGEITD